MGLDVHVRIDLTKPVGKLGFGIPLILEEYAAMEAPYTICNGLEAVLGAGYTKESKVYKAANLIFMQDNAPKEIAVCSTTSKAATWLTTTAEPDWRQLVVVSNGAIDKEEITETVETLDKKLYFANMTFTETDMQLAAKLKGKDYEKTIMFFAASEGDEILSDKYTLVDTETAGTAAYTDTSYEGALLKNNELYNVTVNGETAVATAKSETTGNYVAMTCKGLTIKTKEGELLIQGTTAKDYQVRVAEFSSGYEVAALVGATAGKAPGSITYKNQIIKGIVPNSDYATDTYVDLVHKNGGFTHAIKAGDNVTTEGKVISGEYIDIIDSEDYIIQQLEYKTQKVLNSSDKIPYTNNGIATLESIAVDVLKDAFNNGMIAADSEGNPAYTVNYALKEDMSGDDIANRKYVGGQFSFQLAGAVHEVDIVGEIII